MSYIEIEIAYNNHSIKIDMMSNILKKNIQIQII